MKPDSDKADSPYNFAHDEQHEDSHKQEEPNVYNVEDTPNVFNSRSPKDRHSPEKDIINENDQKIDENSKKNSEKSSAVQSGMASGCTSGLQSGLQSGARTPYCQDTPLMFSRRSTPSVGSIESIDMPENASDSDPGSRPLSGHISPSDIPDSPGQQIQIQRKSDQSDRTGDGSSFPPPTSMYMNPPKPSEQPPGNLYPSHVTQPVSNQQYYNSAPGGYSQMYTPFPAYGGGDQSYAKLDNFADDDDDGPVAFAEEGSMSPRSRTNLSELTIDSKSEPPTPNLQTTREELPVMSKEETDGDQEASFFNHDDTVIPAHDEGDENDDENQDGEEDEDDILAGLYETGLNSIPSIGQPGPPNPGPPQPAKMRQKKSRKPFQHRESLKNVDVLKYIDAKMNENGSEIGNGIGKENETPMENGPTSSKVHVHTKAAENGQQMGKGGESYSAQYCAQIMQADSIKPFNSGMFCLFFL